MKSAAPQGNHRHFRATHEFVDFMTKQRIIADRKQNQKETNKNIENK